MGAIHGKPQYILNYSEQRMNSHDTISLKSLLQPFLYIDTGDDKGEIKEGKTVGQVKELSYVDETVGGMEDGKVDGGGMMVREKVERKVNTLINEGKKVNLMKGGMIARSKMESKIKIIIMYGQILVRKKMKRKG